MIISDLVTHSKTNLENLLLRLHNKIKPSCLFKTLQYSYYKTKNNPKITNIECPCNFLTNFFNNPARSKIKVLADLEHALTQYRVTLETQNFQIENQLPSGNYKKKLLHNYRQQRYGKHNNENERIPQKKHQMQPPHPVI